MFSLFRSSGALVARRTFSTSPIANNSVAKITLLGNLATEPEISTLPNGQEMIRYVVGVSSGRDKPMAWYRVRNFEPEGRGGKEYLATIPKGSVVYVEGDASLRTFEGEDGKKHTDFSVVQRSIKLVFRKKVKEDEGEH